MFIIIDCDDFQDLQITKGDKFTDEEGITLLFDTRKEAEDYADRNLADYIVVEIEE